MFEYIIVHLYNEIKKDGDMNERRYTDCVDELIFKVIHAPVKKLRVELAGGSDVR